jgi:hypothetical protein
MNIRIRSIEQVNMPLIRVVLVSLTLVSAGWGCAVSDDVAPVMYEEKSWSPVNGVSGHQLTTEHFDLRLTVRDELLRSYLPAFMETAYREYSLLMPPERNRDERLKVYVFDTRDQWAHFTSTTYPQHAATYLRITAGGYTDQATATAVAFDLRRDRTLSLLAHEGLHQYLAHHFRRTVVPWLNEGLACQWEAFELNEDRPTFTPRKNHLRMNALAEALTTEDGLIPLESLFKMHAGHALHATDRPVRIYYAQLWSLILFLKEGPHAEEFAELLADAGTDRLDQRVQAYRSEKVANQAISYGELVFRCYITEDLDAFFEQYRAYVRELVS